MGRGWGHGLTKDSAGWAGPETNAKLKCLLYSVLVVSSKGKPDLCPTAGPATLEKSMGAPAGASRVTLRASVSHFPPGLLLAPARAEQRGSRLKGWEEQTALLSLYQNPMEIRQDQDKAGEHNQRLEL